MATALAASLVLTACTGGDSESQDTPEATDAPTAPDSDGPEALTATLDVSELAAAGTPPGALDDEVPAPAPSLEQIVADGVADGRWSLPEGVGGALRWAAGEVPNDDLAALVDDHGELTGLLRQARDLVADDATSAVQRAELERLLAVLAPSADAFDRVSEPATSATALAPSVAPGTLVAAGREPRPAVLAAGPEPGGPTSYSFACSALAADGLDNAELQDGDDPCYLWIERDVEGNQLRVYYPFEWSQDDQRLARVQAMLDALDVSTQVFSRYAEVGDINLAVSLLTADSWPRAHQHYTEKGDTCQLTVFPSAVDGDPDDLVQTLAHEAFHCVQDQAFPSTSPYDAHAWWLEGSAVFFSNVVYPQLNGEHDYIPSFNARSVDTSIFDLSYANTVFFQHLANEYGIQGLWDLLQEVTPGGKDASQSALASRPGFDTVFHDFVIFFLTSRIADTGGGVLAVDSPGATRREVVEDARTIEFEVQPFVAGRLALHYESERFFTQTTDIGQEGRASGVDRPRFSDPSAWGELPEEIRTECDEPAPWPVAVTSVSERVTYTIDVTRVERGICDGCVLGDWELDIATFEESMRSALERQGADRSQINVEGSGTVTFNEDGTFTQVRNVAFTGEFGSAPFGMDAPPGGEYSADGETITLPDENGRPVPVPYTCDLAELVIQEPDFGPIRYVRAPVEPEGEERDPPAAEQPPPVEPQE